MAADGNGISLGDAFALVHELMGEKGVEQLSRMMADAEANPEALRASQEADFARAQELLSKPGDGTLPSRQESIRDLSSLAYLVHVSYALGGDFAKSLVTLHLAIRAAYHTGVSDARLQMFGDAQVAETGTDKGE